MLYFAILVFPFLLPPTGYAAGFFLPVCLTGLPHGAAGVESNLRGIRRSFLSPPAWSRTQRHQA